MNHIDEYDELTAAEIIDHLSVGDFSTDELRAIKTYEHENKDRITVRRTIDDMLVSDTDVGAESTDEDEDEDGDEDESEATRTVEVDTESMSTNDSDTTAARDGATDENSSPQVDEGDLENSDGEPETIQVRLGRSGYAAGHQFDDALETKEVEYNRRVELAIQRGTLQRV